MVYVVYSYVRKGDISVVKIGREHLHKCGHKVEYNEKYDAYYCPSCNVWLEGVCGMDDCVYCKDRPTKPVLQIE